jgi:hypothetical protein
VPAGREPSESFPSALARSFPTGLAVSPACRPSTFSGRVHPSSSFPAPSAFRSTACSLCPPGLWPFDLIRSASERLPWGFVPLRGRQSAAAPAWVPMPHVGIFPESPRLGSALSDFPSSAFRTPSTVSSAADLASLFHPAAAFRVSPSGVCPSLRIRSGFLRSFPLLPLSTRACGRNRASSDCPRLQGFSPRVECGDLRSG